MIITCLLCKREESHEARGLCTPCYQRARRSNMLSAFGLRQRGRPRGPHTDRREYWRLWKQARRRAA